MPETQREYKDRLFCFIFGREEHKSWTLSLYNAVNGTAYTDPEKITIATLAQVLYMGMHGDVAFLIRDEVNLYEQQSTFNPNMPLRLLQYAANLYEMLITLQKKNKYGHKLIPLPVPKLVVFYNGTENMADETVLHLSDAFPAERKDDADIQVRVRMININRNRNPELSAACKPLEEYSWTVDRIRTHEKSMPFSEAVDRTLDEMPEYFEIKQYLLANRAEVTKMLLTEYNEAETMAMFRAEGREEGREEGRKEGSMKEKISGIQRLMSKLKMTADAAMDFMDIPPEDHAKYAQLMKEAGSTEGYDRQ